MLNKEITFLSIKIRNITLQNNVNYIKVNREVIDPMSFNKSIALLIYFILSISFMELLLKGYTTGIIFSESLILPLLFSCSTAILLFIISNIFKNKTGYMVTFILLLMTGFMYCSHFIYFQSFRTFYSLYSAGNATQILEFWKDIWGLIHENWIVFLLFFIPSLFLLILGRKLFVFKRLTKRLSVVIVFLMLIPYSIGLVTVYTGGKEQHSYYDLYFNNHNSILSVQKLGLMTMMQLDFQRSLTGWTPTMAAPVLEATAPSPPVLIDELAEEKVEEETIEYNTMDIKFEELMANAQDPALKEIHHYIKTVVPTEKNVFTGIYKGYNLIFITAESFAPYAVHPEATPTLYKLVHEGYHFTNFYNPLWDVGTTDGEYVATIGLLPKSGVWSFEESSKNYLPFAIGNQLKKQGYSTKAYHNHSYKFYRRDLSHPNMGYEYKGLGNGLDVKKTWPESDLEMFEKTIPEYINDEQFHAYYMTVSGHMQYNFTGNMMAYKNKKLVEDLDYSEEGKAYLATQIELDRSLEHLLAKLEEAGVAEKTLIALSSDHYPYGLDQGVIDELTGHPVETSFEIYKSPFILYTKGMEPMTVDKLSSSLDIIPTLSNLLGLEYDSRLLMGTDIFSEAEPLVPLLDRSFITSKGRYNSVTQLFTPNEGESIEEGYVQAISQMVNQKFYFSAKMLETNYYQQVIPQD
jgi:lipoteichoic acid synthase